MRALSYLVSFFAVVFTLTLNALSLRGNDWLTVKSEVFYSKQMIKFGLLERCERNSISIPGPRDGGRIDWTDYQCHPFPNHETDKCDEENRDFCIAWTTAAYLSGLGVGFAAVACLTIVFGITTHSRRRRAWRAVASLVAMHTSLQIATFAIVTDLYSNDRFPTFAQARPGPAYILNTVSWVVGALITFGVITSGISANKGHTWAAGSRAYQPIEG